MSEQKEADAKLSKSQKKKKKAAQKKKLANKNGIEEVVQDAEWWSQRRRDEIDARIIDEFHDKAMNSREFEMLNKRGKLLVHPSTRFIDALSNQRLIMGREAYPLKIKNIRRYQSLGFHRSMIPSWSMGGHTSFIPLNRLLDPKTDPLGADGTGDCKPPFITLFEPPRPRSKGAHADLSYGTVGFMVWYPILSHCMASGDKLACIAIRDTCVLLRQCYNMFRSDITRLEQFVFDPMDPNNIKQLDWVARRLETPPSPPQTPTSNTHGSTTMNEDTLQANNDPFRFPAVISKRWADYDDDDDSLGSPMSLPITPESSYDVPNLDLDESRQEGGGGGGARSSSNKTAPPRRASTYLVAIPCLTNTAPWFSTEKTVLPVPRITIHIPEAYPRSTTHSTSSSSVHPMKLHTSLSKPFPAEGSAAATTHHYRVKGRIERWVREDAEVKLRAKLALSSAARKQVDNDAELVIYNKITAFNALDSDKIYMGEPDILGAGVGICVDDVREVVLGRFRASSDSSAATKENGSGKRKGGGAVTAATESRVWDKVVLIPGAEGWVCKQLARGGI